VKLVWHKKYRYFKNAFLEEKRIKTLTRAGKERLMRGIKKQDAGRLSGKRRRGAR
jgi:predicted GIY-YIG superfamily endonuclease